MSDISQGNYDLMYNRVRQLAIDFEKAVNGAKNVESVSFWKNALK